MLSLKAQILRFLTTLLVVVLGVSLVLAMLNFREPPANTNLVGDPTRGESIFKIGLNGSPPCSSCHRATANSYSLGLAPDLMGISERAATRIEGFTAEEYIRQSILFPASFVLPGYTVSMYTGYSEFFTEQDIKDLISFLITL